MPVSLPRPVRMGGIVVGGALVLGLLVFGGLRVFGGVPSLDEAALLSARVTALEAQVELAGEDARYVVLDPERGALTLYHGAAALRSWPVLEVEAGARRMGGGADASWHARRWDGARMEPPVVRDRRVIVSDSAVAPDLSGAVEWIPPLPEEAIPAPSRFVVHYAGGLGLEVLSVDPPGDSVGVVVAFPVGRALEHRLRRLLPRNWDRYRVRVRMDVREAGSLYRSLPDSSSFLAVIPSR